MAASRAVDESSVLAAVCAEGDAHAGGAAMTAARRASCTRRGPGARRGSCARRAIAALACIAAIAGFAAAPASAHPLGNFSINHLSEVSISTDRVAVHYI